MAYAHVAHNCQHRRPRRARERGADGGLRHDRGLGDRRRRHGDPPVRAHRLPRMVGGGSRITQDVAPYVKAAGSPPRLAGVNSIGLERRGFSEGRGARSSARTGSCSAAGTVRRRGGAVREEFPGDPRGRALRALRRDLGARAHALMDAMRPVRVGVWGVGVVGREARPRLPRARSKARAGRRPRPRRRRAPPGRAKESRLPRVRLAPRRCSRSARRCRSRCRRSRIAQRSSKRSRPACHVLVEKPMAVTLAEADAMLAAARARGAHAPGRPGRALQPGADRRAARSCGAQVHRGAPARACSSRARSTSTSCSTS